MESLTGLFIFGLCSGLYEATERIWEKGLDAAWPSADAALKADFTRWAAQEKEAERQRVFAEADEIAREATLHQMEDTTPAQRVLDALNGERDPDGIAALARRTARLMLFSPQPDIPQLADICRESLHWDVIWAREQPPSAEAVALVLSNYLVNLRQALLNQPVYEHLLQEDMRRALRKTLREPPSVLYGEDGYRAQIIAMHRTLDFVGIPNLRMGRSITLEDVFIPPRFEHATMVEALRESNRMVILGGPGTGKTTLLKHLSLICAEGRSEEALGWTLKGGASLLPIFVPLREFAAECARRSHDYGLLDYLHTYSHQRLMLTLGPDFFEEALEAGHCLMCLDGLDEVGDVGQRRRVVEAVRALVNRFPRNRYVVTSRPAGYEAVPLAREDFAHHEVLPLTDEDVREFVRASGAEDLLSLIEDEEHIRALTRNPLLLTITALVHRAGVDLPKNRAALYEKCIVTLLETWDEAKGLPIAESRRPSVYRRRLLERLAYELHARGEHNEKGQIKRGDLSVLLTRLLRQNRWLGLEDNLDRARGEAQAFVQMAQRRAGLLAEEGRDTFAFSHLAFQEYLTACDIEKRYVHEGANGVWRGIENHLTDPRWWEVILLLLGRLSQYDDLPSQLVERIVRAGAEDAFEPVLHRHLYLAARALIDQVSVTGGLRRRIVDGLLEAAREAVHWEERVDAFIALSRLKRDAYAIDGLLALARDEQMDWRVRRDAAKTLGELGHHQEAAEVLLALAQDEQVDWRIRRDATIALGQQPAVSEGDLRYTAGEDWKRAEDQVLEGLLALVRGDDVDSWVRRDAAVALGELGRAEDRVLQGLLALVLDEQKDVMARCDAASALGKLGRVEDWVLDGLLTLARNEKVKPLVRSNAASALGELGHTEEAGEILLALVSNKRVDDWVRSAAASALDELDYAEDKVVDGLLALAHDDWVDWQVRRDAVRLLGDLGHAEEHLLDSLLALAQDEQVDSLVRRDAAFALRKLGRPEASEEILLALARDERVDAMVRRAAASKLDELGHSEVVEAVLLELVCDEDVASLVRREAAIALGKLELVEDTGLDTLLALARDEQVDSLVRRAAATVLGRRPVSEAVTADALNRIGEAREILLAMARDEREDVMVRREAASALGEMGRVEEAKEVLLAMAQDEQEDMMVRRKAADALGDLGYIQEAGEILLAMVQDEQAASGTRRAARQSLKRLMGSPIE